MARPPRDELLDHDYDGIQEYDNPIPQWMNVIFFGTVLFSLGYAWYFHLGGPGKSIAERYAEKAQAAASEKQQVAAKHEVSEESLAALMKDPAAVAEGKATFQTTCVACHGAKAEGKIGPNLTDEYWLYGGKLMEIRHTILNGTAKGMPPLGKGMPPEKLDKLVAFLGTLRGTNVPGKEPQGEKFVPEGAQPQAGEAAPGGTADGGAPAVGDGGAADNGAGSDAAAAPTTGAADGG